MINNLFQSKLVKNLFYNLAGLSLPVIVGIVTIPLLIAKLGLQQFGLLSLLWVFLSYASLLDLGLGRAVTQQLSFRLHTNNSRECSDVVWSSLYLLFFLGLIVGISIFCLKKLLIVQVMHVPAPLYAETLNAFNALAFSMPLVIASDCMRGVLEAHHEFGFINFIRLPMGIFTFIAPLVVIYLHGDLGDIAWTLAIGKSLTTLIYFFAALYLMPQLLQHQRFVAKELFTLLGLGGWMTLSNIFSPLLGYADRFFIATISLVSVSYYVTPNEMATKLWLIPGAITSVFFPLMAAAIKNNPVLTRQLVFQALKLIFALLLPIIVILTIWAKPLLTLWINSAFATQSYLLLQIFCFGIFINSLAQVPCSLIQARGYPQWTALTLLCELPVYLVGLFLIVHNSSLSTQNKLIYIAILWACRMLIDAIAMFWLANKIVKLKSIKAQE